MATQSHNSALLDLEPDTIIELYELDLGEEDGMYRFHPGKNDTVDIIFGGYSRTNAMGGPEWVDGHTYYALPIEADGFEVRGDGQLPRPKLIIANPQGIITDLIKRRSDLVGKSIIRKRVFLKFLDHANFPNNLNPFAVPDPSARFDDDIFKINRKVNEDKFQVEFELVSPLELEDIKVPARVMIANYCPWQYRGEGCLYGKRSDFENQKILMADNTEQSAENFFHLAGSCYGNLGLPVADENNKKFTDEDGYNLTLSFQGDYLKTSSYSVGDVVRIQNTSENLAKMETTDLQEEIANKPDAFYVCIQAATNKDPRYELAYWRRDQCAKTLKACKCRYVDYGTYRKGLPFGGFPSIEKYRF